MATVAELIQDTLEDMGVYAAEEAVSAADQALAFRKLNRMLDSWAGERLALFATLRSTHTLTVGLSPHTIGTGGTFNTTRPVRIDRASITAAGATGGETPLDLVTDAEWQALQGKTSSGTPRVLWIEAAHPLMKLHFNPIPSAADTLVLYTWQQLGQFASTATSVDLPPGYERAITSNLAKELAPSFGVSISAELAETAIESKATLKRMNHRPGAMAMDPAIVGASFNIITGGG